jgi:hypothetical protein
MPARAFVVAGSEKAMTASDPAYESPRDRKRLARQAGLGRLSFNSVLAGVLVAYGAFAVLAALVGAVAVAIGVDAELASNDWTTFGRGSAVTATVVAFVAYLFGGYVAGRMARRAGLVNGLAGERWHSDLARWAALGRASPDRDQDGRDRLRHDRRKPLSDSLRPGWSAPRRAWKNIRPRSASLRARWRLLSHGNSGRRSSLTILESSTRCVE